MFRKAAFGYLIVLVVSTYAEIPSYITICGHRNPNLDECVKNSVNDLLPRIHKGIPELGIPPIEPLLISNVVIIDQPNIKASAKDVSAQGLSTLRIQEVHVDFEKQNMDIEMTFDSITLDADYNIKGKILVPIDAKGPIKMVIRNMKMSSTLKYKLIEKDGKQYLHFNSVTIKLDIPDIKVHFKEATDQDNTFVTVMNSVIGNNQADIIKTIKPYMEDVIAKMILNHGNKICKNMTFDELFPDRE